MGEFKKGDRVRIVLEGTINGDGNIEHDDDAWCLYQHVIDNAVSIKKIDPPVTSFKPGDVVRGKHSGSVYTLGRNGVIRHSDGWHLSDDRAENYTSNLFELVTIG